MPKHTYLTLLLALAVATGCGGGQLSDADVDRIATAVVDKTFDAEENATPKAVTFSGVVTFSRWEHSGPEAHSFLDLDTSGDGAADMTVSFADAEPYREVLERCVVGTRVSGAGLRSPGQRWIRATTIKAPAG